MSGTRIRQDMAADFLQSGVAAVWAGDTGRIRGNGFRRGQFAKCQRVGAVVFVRAYGQATVALRRACDCGGTGSARVERAGFQSRTF